MVLVGLLDGKSAKWMLLCRNQSSILGAKYDPHFRFRQKVNKTTWFRYQRHFKRALGGFAALCNVSYSSPSVEFVDVASQGAQVVLNQLTNGISVWKKVTKRCDFIGRKTMLTINFEC